MITLARAYKQIDAPVGQFGRATLAVSTTALAGDDTTYGNLEDRLAALGSRRDALAAQIIQKLEAAEFKNQPLDWPSTFVLLLQANQLLNEASRDSLLWQVGNPLRAAAVLNNLKRTKMGASDSEAPFVFSFVSFVVGVFLSALRRMQHPESVSAVGPD
ncbi:MAG: hypothetical protein WA637_14115 [Terriglobales bacterium]